MARALVIGGDGQIGSALGARLAEAGWETLATTRHPETAADRRPLLDLSRDLASWRPPEGITLAYLCAAVTSLAQCEADPDGTRRLNVEALWAVAHKLLSAGAFVVLPSTNLVFDGSLPGRAATDSVCPLTEYGRQKAELERRLLVPGERAAVVRLTKVLSPQTRLLREWASKLKAGNPIHPFSDMVMAPVSLELALEALLRVGEKRAAGIMQVSAVEDVTYEAAARQLAACLGAREEQIQPVRAAEAGVTPGAAPPHTTLETSRLSQQIGLAPPLARDMLEAIYSQL